MRLVLVVGTMLVVAGCVVRPVVGSGGVGPVYAAPVDGYAVPGWPVIPPPMEVRTPSAALPSFAPPPMVTCRRQFGSGVVCQ